MAAPQGTCREDAAQGHGAVLEAEPVPSASKEAKSDPGR